MSKTNSALTDKTGTNHEVPQSGMATAKQGFKDMVEAAKGKSELATASLRDLIAKKPLKTLGIAVGAGILIGLVVPAIVRSRGRAS